MTGYENNFVPLIDGTSIDQNDWHGERFWSILCPGFYKFECPENERVDCSVIIIPGGAYRKLNPLYNGFQYAKWFNSVGINAYVLLHQLPRGLGLGIALSDLTRTIKIVAKLNPNNKVGIMGCSAGGHLAAMYCNNGVEKIDFAVLMSPVISMIQDAHEHTRNNIGGNPETYSCELGVDNCNPKTLIMHCQEDDKVSPTHSTLYFNALHKVGIRAGLHIFTQGQHDFKIANNRGLVMDGWSKILLDWLNENVRIF